MQNFPTAVNPNKEFPENRTAPPPAKAEARKPCSGGVGGGRGDGGEKKEQLFTFFAQNKLFACHKNDCPKNLNENYPYYAERKNRKPTESRRGERRIARRDKKGRKLDNGKTGTRRNVVCPARNQLLHGSAVDSGNVFYRFRRPEKAEGRPIHSRQTARRRLVGRLLRLGARRHQHDARMLLRPAHLRVRPRRRSPQKGARVADKKQVD